MENLIKMDDLGVPPFSETPISYSLPNDGKAPNLKLFRLFIAAGFETPILKYQLKVCFD